MWRAPPSWRWEGPGKGHLFRSLQGPAAVPLVSRLYGNDVTGILCIHFNAADTLGRPGVRLAPVIANIPADELLKIRRVHRSRESATTPGPV